MILIKVRKICTKNNIHTYSISSNQNGNIEFYVAADPASKSLRAYKDSFTESPSYYVNLENRSASLGSLKGVSQYTYNLGVFQIIQAMEKNELKDCLDYCA